MWQVQLLGGFRLRRDAAALVLPASSARLLAYLCLTDTASRARTAGDLWPDHTQQRANADLRTALWRLQRIDPELVSTSRETLSVDEAVVDVRLVEQWIDAVIHTRDGVGAPPPGAGRELLPGWDSSWLEAPRERLRLLQQQAFESLAGRLLAADRPGEALPYALAVVQAEPLRESANQLMLETHLRQGNVHEAMAHYARYERLVASELGIRPGPAMTFLMASFLPGAGIALPGSRGDRSRTPS